MCVFCPLFDGEGGADCSELQETISGAATAMVELPEGSLIYKEGDQVEGIFCIRSGEVALQKRQAEDEAIRVSIAEPGELLGAMELIGKRQHETEAETISPTTLSYIPGPTFQKLVAERPVIVFNVMKSLCRRLNRLDGEIQGED